MNKNDSAFSDYLKRAYKCYFGVSLVNYGLVLITGFLVLSLLLAHFSKQNDALTTGNNGNSFESGIGSCSANSFLIRDGVCDEITNTQMCLFDGGDCCLSEKRTHLCQTCTCMFDIDNNILSQALKENRVQLYHPAKLDNFEHLKTVEEVLETRVCMWLCLGLNHDRNTDHEMIAKVDAWRFDKNGTCSCMKMMSCHQPCRLIPLHDFKTDNYGLTFLLLSKSVSCESGLCFEANTALKGVVLDAKNAPKTPTSLHCQQICQNTEGCTNFTWISPDYTTPMFSNNLRETCVLSFFANVLADNQLLETKTINDTITGPAYCPEEDGQAKSQQLDRHSSICDAPMEYLSDGFCDDITNNPECLYDGGDCCVAQTDCSYCFNCTCHRMSKGCNTVQTNQFGNKEKALTICNQKDLILVANGWPVMNLLSTEVIHPGDSFFKCQDFQDFPTILATATGGFLEPNTPLICGGLRRDWNDIHMSLVNVPEAGCYTPGQVAPVVNMSLARMGPASIVIDNGKSLWVTGGSDQLHSTFSSSEIVQVDPPIVMPGPDLPLELTLHCIVKLRNGTYLLIGGFNSQELGHVSRYTWSYKDFGSKQWTPGPDLVRARMSHSCGVIQDKYEPEKSIVVVTGGLLDPKTGMDTTELGIVDPTLDYWKLGPAFPVEIDGASGIVSLDGLTFLLFGGFKDLSNVYNTIFSFECINEQCHWTKLDQELKQARARAVAMWIPNRLGSCEKR